MNYSRKHIKHLAYIEKFRVAAVLRPAAIKVQYKVKAREINEWARIDPCYRNQQKWRRKDNE